MPSEVSMSGVAINGARQIQDPTFRVASEGAFFIQMGRLQRDALLHRIIRSLFCAL